MTWKTGNLFVEEEESWWCSLFLSSQHRGLSMALFVALKMKYVNILSWKRVIVNRPVTAFSCAGVFFSNQLKDQFARTFAWYLPQSQHLNGRADRNKLLLSDMQRQHDVTGLPLLSVLRNQMLRQQFTFMLIFPCNNRVNSGSTWNTGKPRAMTLGGQARGETKGGEESKERGEK